MTVSGSVYSEIDMSGGNFTLYHSMNLGQMVISLLLVLILITLVMRWLYDAFLRG